MNKLYEINDLIEGEIICRPSTKIKTPFVADIKIISNNKIILGHTASLGCCGLADKGAHILMAPSKNKNNKCDYVVYLSIFMDKNKKIIIGIYPKLAETLTEKAIKLNLLSKLVNIKSLKKEEKILNSRFDFTGVDQNNIPFVMEVKNVPLADYEDLTAKERKKHCFDGRCVDSKVAYFPDGYRKKATDTISPRALKHLNDLILLKKQHKNKMRCLMCYVIQRTDIDRFTPSIIDPEYRKTFKEAIKNGVEIIVMVIKWTIDGNAYFVRDDLPIDLHP